MERYGRYNILDIIWFMGELVYPRNLFWIWNKKIWINVQKGSYHISAKYKEYKKFKEKHPLWIVLHQEKISKMRA